MPHEGQQETPAVTSHMNGALGWGISRRYRTSKHICTQSRPWGVPSPDFNPTTYHLPCPSHIDSTIQCDAVDPILFTSMAVDWVSTKLLQRLPLPLIFFSPKPCYAWGICDGTGFRQKKMVVRWPIKQNETSKHKTHTQQKEKKPQTQGQVPCNQKGQKARTQPRSNVPLLESRNAKGKNPTHKSDAAEGTE